MGGGIPRRRYSTNQFSLWGLARGRSGGSSDRKDLRENIAGRNACRLGRPSAKLPVRHQKRARVRRFDSPSREPRLYSRPPAAGSCRPLARNRTVLPNFDSKLVPSTRTPCPNAQGGTADEVPAAAGRPHIGRMIFVHGRQYRPTVLETPSAKRYAVGVETFAGLATRACFPVSEVDLTYILGYALRCSSAISSAVPIWISGPLPIPGQ